VNMNAPIRIKCKAKRKAALLCSETFFLKTHVSENPCVRKRLAKACKIQAKVAGEKLGVWFATAAALHEAARPDRHLFLEAKSYVLLTRVTPRARIPRQNILQARERAPQSLYGQLAEEVSCQLH
jgi:hypothetical protein